MSATEIGQQAAGQAGGAAKKAGSKVASKAVGKAGKYLKKLLVKFLKQLIMSLGKIIISVIGPWGLAILIVILIVLAVLSALPFADWFLGGNARTDDQKNADLAYLHKFQSAADKTVSELYGIEADKNWINQLVKTVKPSFGIPSALVQYEILVKEKKVNLNDYDPDELIRRFAPSYTYTTITDDIERTKSVKACTVVTVDSTTGTSTSSTTTSESITESFRPPHKVLSQISFEYGNMSIGSLKSYYPGGKTTPTSDWEYVGVSNSGNCVITSYRQYEHTTVDDRFVPSLSIDGAKFQSILTELGVDEDDMKVFYEFIHSADPNWNPALYGSKSPGGFGYGFNGSWLPGYASVPDVVLRYEPIVRKYLAGYGLEAHTQLILALIMQESGGRLLDVMQSSESKGWKRNTITDPELSIRYGIDHFASVYASANGDVKLTLQAYNFGGGFIDYANERGGYTLENAIAFSKMKAAEKGWKRYGDPYYVDHVMRYYNATSTAIDIIPGEQIFDVQAILNSIEPYMGMKYHWGGASPATSFDCSGLLQYVFGLNGIRLPRTAAEQYKVTVPVSEKDAKPGDFVFWMTDGKAYPSHVGMYLGNGKFVNSGSTYGVSNDTLHRWRKQKFLGFRRLVK